ncbi:ATP-dependent DNA helicase PIF1-like protein [Tanacetum coccineum]
MITETYPNFIERERDDAYLRERAILTPRNDDANAINTYMFDKLEGEFVTYNSVDEGFAAALAVLITGASQSRQHGMSEPARRSLTD